VAVCSFCPLLCEYDPDGLDSNAASVDAVIQVKSHLAKQSTGSRASHSASPSTSQGLQSNASFQVTNVSQCSLRARSLIELESLSADLTRFELNDPARSLKIANQWIEESSRIVITGRVTSIETSRAVLDLARRIHAFVDIDGSVAAFHQIRAVQRSGMFTATFSEIRFRSDLVVLIGSDQLIEQFPRILERLSNKQATNHSAKSDKNSSSPAPSELTSNSVSKTILCLGAWSEESVDHLKQHFDNVIAIPMGLQTIPAELFRATSSSDLLASDSLSTVQKLLDVASYTSVIWSNSLLHWKHADLWVERLFQWIAQQNRLTRCVGLPLSSYYGTFQQVCNWTTGFPGRVRFLEEFETSFEPEESSRELSAADLEIRVDEQSSATMNSKTNRRLISIGFHPQESNEDCLHFSSLNAGYHYSAEYFRADGTIVLQAGPESQATAIQLSKPSDWLNRLGGGIS
jgi:hypothetical protein